MAETRLVVQHREQLWSLLSRQCSGIATQDGVPAAVSSAATTAAAISGQLAGHVPQELRPA